MKRISIVTAYFNRRKLFINTLITIEKQDYPNIEVIAVDDASHDSERIEDLVSLYPFLRVIRVEPDEKNYTCSCMAFNRGIAQADGDIIVLQNPECIHVGKVLEFISDAINDGNYISLAAYSLTEEANSFADIAIEQDMLTYMLRLMPQCAYNGLGYYNHSIYQPIGYHFCAAMSRKTMDNLGGFDERYAEGIAFDDNELLERVKRMGLEIKIVDYPCVMHQWHSRLHNEGRENFHELLERNEHLFDEFTKKESIITVNNSYKMND